MRNKHLLLPAVLAVFSLSTLALASEDGRFERTLKVTGVPQVDVSTGSGDITIRQGDNTSIKVIGHIHRSHGWFSGSSDMDRVHRIEQNPPIEQTGNIVRIGRFSDPELRRNISIDFEVWLPRENTLKANSGSGDVSVENLKSMLTVSTGSGNVRVNGNDGDVRANTGSGDVVLESISGNVNGETGSGNVHADGDVTSEWNVETGSGDVSVSFPQNAKFELNAQTGSGDLHINRDVMINGTQNPHRMHGKVNGGGPLVQLQTSSGNIDLR